MIINANSLHIPLRDKSVHCCVTSPPYWGLRDYGVDNQLGLEQTPEQYVENMCYVFGEVWRVLRDDGTAWLNLGDSYSGSGKGIGSDHGVAAISDNEISKTDWTKCGLKPKDLVGIPWRVAFALQAQGWYLRSDIIWSKTNPMPESVKDRPAKSHEYIFLLTKSERYFYDWFAIREPAVSGPDKLKSHHDPENPKYKAAPSEKWKDQFNGRTWGEVGSRNRRTVWEIATQSYSEAHFACVTPDTEILTINGWANYKQLDYKKHTKIATYNTSKNIIEYQPLKWIGEYNFEGKLISVGNRDLDILMTPNHRNIIKRRSGDIAIKEAKDLTTNDKIKVLADVEWRAKYSIGTNWAFLVGWIISEGHYKKGGYIEIYQNVGDDERLIDQALSDCEIKHTKNIRTRNYNGEKKKQCTWYISKCAFVDWMYTYVPKKTLNKLLVSLPRQELESMLVSLLRGDGSYRDDGRVSFIQKDKSCMDWFEILAMRCGYHTLTTKRGDGNYVCYLTEKKEIGIRGTNGKGSSIKKIKYSGKVWCPSVENGTWIAKRNGKVFITGNTFPEKLVVDPIKAGTSEKGCCSECGAPWERVVEQESRYEKRQDRGQPEWKGAQVDSSGWKEPITKQIGWQPTCNCGIETDRGHVDIKPCIVLDPFGGSGTTKAVAGRMGRDAVIIELNPEYVEIAKDRCNTDQYKLAI